MPRVAERRGSRWAGKAAALLLSLFHLQCGGGEEDVFHPCGPGEVLAFSGRGILESTMPGESAAFAYEGRLFFLGPDSAGTERVLGTVSALEISGEADTVGSALVGPVVVALSGDSTGWNGYPLTRNVPLSLALDWKSLLPPGREPGITTGSRWQRREALYLCEADTATWAYRVEALADSSAAYALRRRPADPYPISGDATLFEDFRLLRDETDWSFSPEGELHEMRRLLEIRGTFLGREVRETTRNRVSYRRLPPLSSGGLAILSSQWPVLVQLPPLLAEGDRDRVREMLGDLRERAPGGPLEAALQRLEAWAWGQETPRAGKGRRTEPRWLAEMRGRRAPDFVLTSLRGEEIASEALRGKVVLLQFFGLWCGPCRRESRILQRLWDDYRGAGLLVLAVDVLNDKEERLREFVEREGITYPMLREGGSLAGAYGIRAVPVTVLLDKEWRVSAAFVGLWSAMEDTLRARLETLLEGK
jgi:peroxiredoxin